MLSVSTNYSLATLNTFGIKASAEYFSTLTQESQLASLAHQKEFAKGLFILGGGSNCLFTRDLSAWVIHNELKGIKVLKEDETSVWLEVAAGENWHRFVLYCVNNGWGGVENLSLIPGKVGGAPIQNIGAYGVEVKDTLISVNAWHIEEGRRHEFSLSDCELGYRDSIFKRAYRGQFIICSVVFKLSKQPVFDVSYGSIQQELEREGVTQLSLKAISDAIISIRQAKLPDPAKIGNGGSFFKNPIISLAQFVALQKRNPRLPHYSLSNQRVKVPAAWLIEQCGWKGYRQGDAGVHTKQALVLVNYGEAKGEEIYKLSEEIIASVKERFGIELTREVWVF